MVEGDLIRLLALGDLLLQLVELLIDEGPRRLALLGIGDSGGHLTTGLELLNHLLEEGGVLALEPSGFKTGFLLGQLAFSLLLQHLIAAERHRQGGGEADGQEAAENANSPQQRRALLAAIIQAQSDSTLDLAIADLNNDGRHDIITVQGESGNFTNKFYRNTGAVDTRAPVLVAVQADSAAAGSGPWIAKAKIRDQVLDDGVNHVRGWIESIPVQAATNEVVAGFNGAALSLPASVPAGTMLVLRNDGATAASVVVSGARPWSGSVAPGATFVVGCVVPGAYVVTNGQGGTANLVVDAGAWTSAQGLHQGGQQYRFATSAPGAGAGTGIARQLRFVDWSGNTTMVALPTLILPATDTGTPYCFGDGSGVACPCGNASSAGAAAGCLNSLGTAGTLRGAGLASIASDSFQLRGSAMANSSALYFQGTTQAGAGLGTVFGDGLRCAAGSVIRLGTKVNAAGQSTFPGAGDPSVSVRGAVPAGSTRTYQVWYRNAAAFCAAETFNLTNGLSVAWAP